MKTLPYLLLFLFSFSIISAQEKLSKEEIARREKNVQAGNPFVKFGSKAPVATLSKGKYLEVHDLDSIVTIGTTRWHVDKKQIVGNIIQDTLNPDAQPIGDRAGRWISIDPLSEEFPSTSPYVSFNNNPIRFNDPTGMAPEIADFEPTKEGNLRVEKGDTAEKLKKEYGVVVTDKNFEFKEGNVITLDNNMTRSIEKSSKTEGFDAKTDAYNCHGAAIATVQGKEINSETAGFKGSLFDPMTTSDDKFQSSFKEIPSTDKAVFGKTVLSFGDHSAVFYGSDNKGTDYFYSKNGTNKPSIFTTTELKSFYPDNKTPKLLNYEPKKNP